MTLRSELSGRRSHLRLDARSLRGIAAVHQPGRVRRVAAHAGQIVRGGLDGHAVDATQETRGARVGEATPVDVDESWLVAVEVQAARVAHLRVCAYGGRAPLTVMQASQKLRRGGTSRSERQRAGACEHLRASSVDDDPKRRDDLVDLRVVELRRHKRTGGHGQPIKTRTAKQFQRKHKW